MAVKDEITRLELAKTNFKNEFSKIGVNIPSNAKLDAYYTYVRDYVSKFNDRLETLESNAEHSLYFSGATVTGDMDTVDSKLSFFEETEENAIYLKG